MPRLRKNSRPAAFLDLDAVMPEREIVIRIFGTEYHLKQMTVQDFIEYQKKRQSTDKKLAETPDNADTTELFQFMKDELLTLFPDMMEETLDRMTLPQLQKLVEFAQEQTADATKEAITGGVEKGDDAEDPSKAG